TGIASATASASFPTRSGLTFMKNKNVAASMSITSTKVAVIMRVPCLNCDNAIRMTISASDSAAEVAGRRSRTSQKKVSAAQVRTNAACADGSSSDQSNMPKAARWVAASAKRPAYRRSAAARRFFRSRTAGGMTRSRALVEFTAAGGCHLSVIKLSWQGPAESGGGSPSFPGYAGRQRRANQDHSKAYRGGDVVSA